MTPNEMLECLEEVQQYFNSRYTEPQLAVMFRKYNKIRKSTFQKICDKAIELSRTLPKIIDFEMAKASVKEELVYTDDFQETKCDLCGGLGYVFFYQEKRDGDKKYPYQYALRCICENGEHQPHNIPTFGEIGFSVDFFKKIPNNERKIPAKNEETNEEPLDKIEQLSQTVFKTMEE